VSSNRTHSSSPEANSCSRNGKMSEIVKDLRRAILEFLKETKPDFLPVEQKRYPEAGK
jgi:hypothetical protein